MHGAASDTHPVAQALIAAGELPELRGFKTSTAAAKRKARKDDPVEEMAFVDVVRDLLIKTYGIKTLAM